jgi:hypothetical protein
VRGERRGKCGVKCGVKCDALYFNFFFLYMNKLLI